MVRTGYPSQIAQAQALERRIALPLYALLMRRVRARMGRRGR